MSEPIVHRISEHFMSFLPDGNKGANSNAETVEKSFCVIHDRFDTLDAVSKEIKSVVDVNCGLILGIDYTMSNIKQGQNTFGGRSLHDVSEGVVNPYEEVICTLGETIEKMDSDGFIPAFGFGDKSVKDTGIFPLKKQGECQGFLEVLDVYKTVTAEIKLGGGTNFAPLIEEAVRVVKKTKMYHILVIAADGQVNKEEETIEAIVEASNYPLSIVLIGVGDGPWAVMKEFDDKLPQRRFDNFQFANFAQSKTKRNPEAAMALAALMEIPDQFRAIKDLKLLEKL